MFNWNKKEVPLNALAGMGGGAGSLVPSQTLFDETWASGGAVGDYESGGTFYRVHVFLSPGTFTVSDGQLTGINLSLIHISEPTRPY